MELYSVHIDKEDHTRKGIASNIRSILSKIDDDQLKNAQNTEDCLSRMLDEMVRKESIILFQLGGCGNITNIEICLTDESLGTLPVTNEMITRQIKRLIIMAQQAKGL